MPDKISKGGPEKSDVIPISKTLVTEPLAGPAGGLSLEDRNISRRVFYLSLQAIFNAILIGFIAKALVALIDLCTNLFFYGHFSFQSAAPGLDHLGPFVVLIPVIGGLIVGLMARFGSPGIRGHGIPEAMEQVLLNESKISPIITFLKPLSSAIAIGTGGPFGAEGPIIATGGAFGSLTGQIMRISANERKIMLTSGACAGMAAIFGSPIAGVLMAMELLLFEFSPRALIPIALSSCTGAACHFLLFSTRPIFEMHSVAIPSSVAIITYTILGVVVGVAAAFVSKSVYVVEDLFKKLPVHWMWWPAIGAIAVGLTGYFFPQIMGVGYTNISYLLTGNVPLKLLFAFCILKFIAWSVSLGSGTSGGTLAPLFTIGGGLGALLGMLTLYLFPSSEINIATATLIGMAALFAGASRALLTSIVFALETTGQLHDLLPLIGACTSAYFVSFFLMKGSIMTMKIERRGLKIPEKFEPDIFLSLLVKSVMTSGRNVLNENNTIKECREYIHQHQPWKEDVSFIVTDNNRILVGIVHVEDIFDEDIPDNSPVGSIAGTKNAFVYPEMQLSVAIEMMDEYETAALPVVSPDKNREVVGVLTYKNVFEAYRKRRSDDEMYKQSISLKWRSLRALIKGKQIFEKRSEKIMRK